jgi:hypothetical protein
VLSSDETWKPAGALAAIVVLRAVPVTVTEVDKEAVPVKELNAPALPAVIVGVEGTVVSMPALVADHAETP